MINLKRLKKIAYMALILQFININPIFAKK